MARSFPYYGSGGNASKATVYLFNITDDPTETTNLADQFPRVVTSIRKKARASESATRLDTTRQQSPQLASICRSSRHGSVC